MGAFRETHLGRYLLSYATLHHIEFMSEQHRQLTYMKPSPGSSWFCIISMFYYWNDNASKGSDYKTARYIIIINATLFFFLYAHFY